MEGLLQNPAFVLFAILAAGLSLGRITFKGISLGTSGVLFVALAAGHFGLKVPEGVTALGTALFVYCVGLGAGNRFFSSLRSRGAGLVLLSLVVVGTAWCITLAGCKLLGINAAIGAGLFAGACTSTPGLAAATEALEQHGLNTAAVNIGYGVVYPFGVIGVVLFVQLLPRLIHNPWENLRSHSAPNDPRQIITRVISVTNPNIIGRSIAEVQHSGSLQCRVTRRLEDDRFVPLNGEDCFSAGTEVMLVGPREAMERDALLLGHVDKEAPVGNRFAGESDEVIVLEKCMSNRTLHELNTLQTDGVTVSRITRLGVTFVPTDETEIMRNDVLHVVGMPEDIESFKRRCRHRSSAIGAADIFSLTAGVALGILVGHISIGGFTLGMAGGPLLVALVLGHFGHIGPVAGYMPRPARTLLTEFALMLFLAGAGVSGGSALVETLKQQGASMFFLGVFITSVPLGMGYVFARRCLHLSMEEALGGICGGMTSTPALGAITSKTDKQSPVISYATAYPGALILMALLAKALISAGCLP